ncbi:S8 family serine peptidase [Dokdonella soli]|uniref:S8 family serine peptidase n=1 Tax=Dokdonella soli TaxID=529810 RepID=UPI0031E33C1A
MTTGRYIITFAEAGLANYKGGISGLQRTAPASDLVSANSSRKVDANSPAANSYKAYLSAQRDYYISAIEQKLGRNLAISFTYDVTRSAISVAMSQAEAAAVAGVPGVVSVSAVAVLQPDTFRGPTFIGANTIWDGTKVPSYAAATRGQGVRVGVIDTGSYAAHPSFANDPMCGFSNTHPKLHAKDCMTNNGTSCTGTTPEADSGNGHGVHTSSTAAGNTIDNTVSPAPLLPNGVTMSGVAPCAEVFTYKVCNVAKGCTSDAITAAIQNAITDQVDVVNYSIGPTCGGGDPWQDSLDFLSAEGADVFVAASAGNTRATCTNPTTLVANNGPWMLTVAASTQDQLISPQLTAVGPGTPPAATQNVPLIAGSTTLTPAATTDLTSYPLLTNPANPVGCTATGGITVNFTGTIAILRRGSCAFSEKITNAYNAGARMVVIGNNQAGSISMDTSTLTAAIAGNVAAFSMTQVPGDALIAFVNANAGSTGNYRRAVIGPVQGDVLAGFSFRGPTMAPYDDLTKPDITGPGVNIYAALDAGEGNYGLFSGTSMSSPHLAGSGALVRAVHPSWSPMEVKSALQTTATLTGTKEDGTTQWAVDDVGGGRVDLTKATLAGLTLDETPDNFLLANPHRGVVADTIFIDGFDPAALPIKDLNVASLRNSKCGTGCTWTRTFRNRLNKSGNWALAAGVNPAGYTLSFSPAAFTLAPGYTQQVTITATAIGATSTQFAYGRVDLHESGSLSPDQHLTVAVKAQQPVHDSSFETTTGPAGTNPSWDALDTNPGAAGGTNFFNNTTALPVPVRTGNWAVWFGGWGGGAEVQHISQSVTFPAGGPQFLNYWRRAATPPDAAGTLTVSIDGTAVETTNLSTITAETAYGHHSIDVSAYANGAAHVIKFEYVYADAAATHKDGNIFIDDVTLDPTNVSPFLAPSPVLSPDAGLLKQAD